MNDHHRVARMGLAVAVFILALAGSLEGQEFLPRVSLEVGGSVLGVASGDYDGDGRKDLAVGSNTLFQMKVFYGQTDGSLGTPITLTTPGDLPNIITSADLDADGYDDLVFKNTPGIATVNGQANRTFTDLLTYSAYLVRIEDIVASDLNGDGRPDIIVSDSYRSKVAVFSSQPSGGFGAAEKYSVSRAQGIAAADFNGDGFQDIAVANSDDGEVSVLYGSLGGGLSKIDYAATSKADGLVAADFNGDDLLDLAYTTSAGGDSVGVLLGLPGGGFSSASLFPTAESPMDIASGDFDRDGSVDLVVVTQRTNYVSILMGVGDGAFGERTDLRASARGSSSVIVVDLDGNGWADIAVASGSGGYVDVFYGIPEPTTLSLLAIGGLGLIRGRRRWRRTGEDRNRRR